VTRRHFGQSGYGQSQALSNPKCGVRALAPAAPARYRLERADRKGEEMIIAVDGPAASGKGTLASGLAGHYGLPHLDTGLLYRAVGLAVAEKEHAPAFETAAIAAAQALDPTRLGDPDALTAAHTGVLASKVAVIAEVRKALFDVQRSFATNGNGAVLDGRDIGTVICPDADVKLFIRADSKARMERRARQLENRGVVVDRYALYHQIEERDARDMLNPHGGFYPADDAHLLDTTLLGIEAALRAAIAIVDRTMALKAGGPAPL
jgi:CMP/dCMP kinase